MINLPDSAVDAVYAAAAPIPSHLRDAFVADVAAMLAQLPEIGPGVVHRAIVVAQRKYFDPPELDRDVSKYRLARRGV